MSIIDKILFNLKRDNPQAKEVNNYLRELTCHNCGKHESWTSLDNPRVIFCPRTDKCGASFTAKELYPELFSDFQKYFPPTQSNPNATAMAYLESRGLDHSLFDYSQFSYFDKYTNCYYPTVKIKIDNEQSFYRLIDYNGDNKARFEHGKQLSGKCYQKIIGDNNQIYLVEGIFDCLSLAQSKLNSIAVLTSNANPNNFNCWNKAHEYILAFDNDPAGLKAVKNYSDYFNDNGYKYRVALPQQGKDWNDLLQSNKLTSDDFKKYFHYGKLAQCKTAEEYCHEYFEYKELTHAIFEFDNKTYLGKMDDDVVETKLLIDCVIKIKYSVVKEIEDSRQIVHCVELKSVREKINTDIITAHDLTSVESFKLKLANNRQVFFGNSHDLTYYASYLFNSRPAKIRELNATGYDVKSNSFYFNKFAYDQNGKRIEINSNGYFDNLNIKPFNCNECINKLADININEFLSNLYSAYGNNGYLALGFYISSLFSHDVFNEYGFFPFLSLHGAAHSGKSVLTKLLNRAFFIDSEGITMTSANTAKSELRKIAQKNSMVNCLLEGRKDKSRFDYDSILPLYNRNNLYSRAQTSQDNKTHDLEFNSTLSFIWNKELFTLKPAKERIISLYFDDKHHKETENAFNQILKYTNSQLAGIGHFVLSNRKYFEQNLITQINVNSQILKNNGVKINRIADNHAIAYGGITCLCELAKCFDSDQRIKLRDYTVKIAKTKIENAKTDLSLADNFLEAIKNLAKNDGVIKNDEHYIVHLNTALATLAKNFDSYDKSKLIPELKVHDRFIGIKTTRAFEGVLTLNRPDAYLFKLED